MVEQATAASHTLAQEAEDLTHMMGQFNVGALSATAVRAGPKRPTPAANPVHTVQAKITASVGGGRAAASAPADDGWTEF